MTLDTKQLQNKTQRPTQLTPQLTADLEFAIINGETALPSKSKFYRNKLVYVRGLRYKEQLEISGVDNRVDDPFIAYSSVIRVYKNCIQIEGVEFEDILEEDFTTLSLWIVFLTNPEQSYQISYQCKQCNTKNTQTIIPSQIELLDFELYEPQLLDTELGRLLIAPLTMKENLWAFSANTEGINESLILGKHIKSRNGQPLEDLQTRLDLFGALTPKEVDEIKSIVLKYKSGVKPVQCRCTECQHEQGILPTLDLLRGLP